MFRLYYKHKLYLSFVRTYTKFIMKTEVRHRGFTIVELLIVIVVIAILAAVTVVAFNGIQERAKNTAIASEVGKMNKYLRLYIAQSGPAQLKSIMPPPVGGAPATACLGTGYEDVVEGSAVGCYTNQVGQSVTSNTSLDSALQVFGNTALSSYPPITITVDLQDPPLRQSAPVLTLVASSQHLVDGRPNVFGYIRYILKGANVDCVSKPMLVYQGSSGGNYLYTASSNAKNSSYSTDDGGYTTCDLYFHPDAA